MHDWSWADVQEDWRSSAFLPAPAPSPFSSDWANPSLELPPLPSSHPADNGDGEKAASGHPLSTRLTPKWSFLFLLPSQTCPLPQPNSKPLLGLGGWGVEGSCCNSVTHGNFWEAPLVRVGSSMSVSTLQSNLLQYLH